MTFLVSSKCCSWKVTRFDRDLVEALTSSTSMEQGFSLDNNSKSSNNSSGTRSDGGLVNRYYIRKHFWFRFSVLRLSLHLFHLRAQEELRSFVNHFHSLKCFEWGDKWDDKQFFGRSACVNFEYDFGWLIIYTSKCFSLAFS